MVSRHARRRLWLRGHCPWMGTPLPTSWRAHKGAAQEIEARAPEHLALEPREAIDMPLHRARTPGECHARFDRLIVLAEPLGNASQGLQRPGGGACQPGIEAFRLPLAPEFRTVLGQVDGCGHFGLLGAPWRKLLSLCYGLGEWIEAGFLWCYGNRFTSHLREASSASSSH